MGKCFNRSCRNCGKEIDFKEYLKNHICPYCNKSMSEYMRDIHIVFNNQFQCTLSYLLNNYNGELYENAIEYRVFCLEYYMEIGNLSNVPYSNQKEYARLQTDYSYALKRVEKVLTEIKAFSPKTKVYLWVNDNNLNEYLNFLFFANEFKLFNEVYLVDSKEGNAKKKYIPKKALDKKKRLSNIALDRFDKKFYTIKTEENKLNLLVDKKIKIFSLNKFSAKVLELVRSRYEPESYLEARYFKKYNGTEFELTYWQLKRVIFYLYENYKIDYKFDIDIDFNKLRLRKEVTTEKKGVRFTNDEKDLISLLHAMGFSDQDITGIFLVSKKIAVRKTLLKYLQFKWEYATYSDALSFAMAVERTLGRRHQYLPFKMFVRYIGETTSELINGDYYQVKTVYGIKDKRYYLMNEKNKMKEYPASNFILLRPSRIIYEGQEENGLVPDEEYDVVEQKGRRYVLSGGQEVSGYDVDEIEFVIAEEKPKQPIEHETVLQLLLHAFEFGDMHQVYSRMTDNTIYYSAGKDLTITGRDEILDYIEDIFKNRVEQNVFGDVAFCTVTKDFKEHKVGERFLMMFETNRTKNSIFAYSDGTYITKIVVSDEWPAYACDAAETNNLTQIKDN